MKNRTLFTILFLLLVCTGALQAEAVEPFKLNPLTDGIIAGGGLVLAGADLCLEEAGGEGVGFSFTEPDRGAINPVDSLVLRRYSEPLDGLSTGLSLAVMLSPAVLAAVPSDQWLTIGLMYSESVLWCWGLKELGKNVVRRQRPYTFFDGVPEDDIADADHLRSFPSGHTALAFNGAAFCSYLCSRYYPGSPWRFPLTAGVFTLAASTAVMRVASGSHFLSDVAAGALIGLVTGFAVPMLHELRLGRDGEGAALSVSPAGVSCSLSF